MRNKVTYGLVTLALLGAAGCDSSSAGSKEPSGQVVAVVGGEEITVRELNQELGGMNTSDAQVMEAAEEAALNAIINRKLLAKAAREQGLEESAEFQLSQRRAEEVMLAQAMQRQVAQQVARPTREEAEAYMAAHPNIFAERKIYRLDQIQFAKEGGREVIERIKDLDSMNEVEQSLLGSGVRHTRAPATLDARSTPPELVAQIAQLPPNELFLVPGGNAVMVNQVLETQVEPFTGEDAIAHAQRLIFQERVGEALKKQLDDERKAAGQIQYNRNYGPEQQPQQQNAT